MPVFKLPRQIVFPDPALAEPDGLLAAGGDLSVERLLCAYRLGIFPWYNEGLPILWWSPDPRLVLEPGGLRISKSLRRTLKKRHFAVTLDRAFERVITSCATAERSGDVPGTWIVDDMKYAYVEMYNEGYAHSVEVWEDDALAGGLYGVSLGKAFFGESMFFKKRDASKVALAYLAAALNIWRFDFIDCQVKTEHLIRLGAKEEPRSLFLKRLKNALASQTRRGPWHLPPDIELPV